jgi:ribosomal protein L16/L10AE
MKKQTYVLFVPGKRTPTVYHNSIETAREEANRLLAQDENKQVMICEFAEGLEKVIKHKPLTKNPLTDRDAPMPF